MTAPVNERWTAHGWAVERAVLSTDHIEAARAEVERLFLDADLVAPGNGRTRVRATLEGGLVVDRLDPVCDVSPFLDELARTSPLADLAASAIGADARLFKDKVITKPPGTTGYGLHQDFMRWQDFGVAADEMVTLAVGLDRATATSGAVEVFTGQHDRLLTAPGVTADPEPHTVDATCTDLVELDAGDVLLLHPLVPHRSGPNRSTEPRRILFFTYSSSRHGDLRDTYYERHAEIFGAALGPTLDAASTSSPDRR